MGNNLLSENKTDIMTRKRKLLFIMAGIFILLVISYISISLYYNTHFYMNTTINGIETSNMTVEQAEEVIQKEFKSYSLSLVGRNDLTDQLNGRDFNIYARFDGSLEDLLDSQNSFMWISALFKIPSWRSELCQSMMKTFKDLVSNQPTFRKRTWLSQSMPISLNTGKGL